MNALYRKGWRLISFFDSYTGASYFFDDYGNVVVMYHAVGEPSLFGNITPDRFQSDVRCFIKEFDVVDLPGVLRNDGEERKLAITFDDGYGNFYRNAYPILEKFNVPVTLFVTSGFIGGDMETRIQEQHGLSAVDEDTMMDHNEIREMVDSPLVTIGNHTRTHTRLSQYTDRERLEREIIGAKTDLETEFGISIDRFSYPHGEVGTVADELIRQSHNIAVTSNNGLVLNESDRYLLPRIRTHVPQYQLEWEVTGLSQRIREFVGVD